MAPQPIIALMYDFDNTLSTEDMQDYSFIPSLGLSVPAFWQLANEFGRRERMDGILAYMFTMIREAHRCGRPLTRHQLTEAGRDIRLFPGVEGWFGRINAFGASLGVTVEHYIISSGLKEILEGCSIGAEFKEIFASEFYYGEDGEAAWPKLAVNYTRRLKWPLVKSLNGGSIVFPPIKDAEKASSTFSVCCASSTVNCRRMRASPCAVLNPHCQAGTRGTDYKWYCSRTGSGSSPAAWPRSGPSASAGPGHGCMI